MMTSNDVTPMLLHHTGLVLSPAEITDGITTTNRLEEIVSAIAKAYPNPSKEGNTNPNPNPDSSDVLTQWYSLVHALAATSDEACIRHFIDKLNGISLTTDWVRMAQDLSNEVTTADVSKGFSDKLIVSLLNLFDRLPVEAYMLVDGGTLSVIKELGTSKSSEIRDMALALHDKWRPAEVGTGLSCQLTNSTIPENSETVKEEPEKSNSSAKLNFSGSPIKGKSVEEDEEDEEAEEQVNNPSDPVSPSYSSDVGSMPDTKTMLSPTEERKKVATVYDDDMDALEIARQVAIQVEEEVVQYRETLCSSPEEETNPGEADFPLTESTKVKTDQNGVERVYAIPSLREDDSVLTTGTHEEDRVKARKADGSGLDLNENLCPDYETTPELIHVAASKGVLPFSTIPISSCCFEAGTSAGWTGTAAATSAFRPASPRGGAHPSINRSVIGTAGLADLVDLKRKYSSCLAFDFDLNVAETNTAEVILPPSGDSSTEVSSERAKKLKLDLNFTDEAEVVEPIPAHTPPLQAPSYVLGDHGYSSASSSSLKNQVKFDFDLNDDLSRRTAGQNSNSVKLMGWNAAGSTVSRNQATPPIFHSFLGPNAASPQFGSLSGPTNLYHSHMMPTSSYGYQYNPAPQVWYGQPSTSYALGPPFLPQMVGPVSESGPSVGLSLMPGDRSNFFRPSLDLNAASTGSVEATNREVVGFRQFFVQSHSGLVQEPVMNATAQPTVPTPGNGVRWREQERERETFSYGFKQLI